MTRADLAVSGNDVQALGASGPRGGKGAISAARPGARGALSQSAGPAAAPGQKAAPVNTVGFALAAALGNVVGAHGGGPTPAPGATVHRRLPGLWCRVHAGRHRSGRDAPGPGWRPLTQRSLCWRATSRCTWLSTCSRPTFTLERRPTAERVGRHLGPVGSDSAHLLRRGGHCQRISGLGPARDPAVPCGPATQAAGRRDHSECDGRRRAEPRPGSWGRRGPRGRYDTGSSADRAGCLRSRGTGSLFPPESPSTSRPPTWYRSSRPSGDG